MMDSQSNTYRLTSGQHIVLFLLFLSSSCSITYWAIAKYDPATDWSAAGDVVSYEKMSHMEYEGVERRYQYRVLMPSMVYGVRVVGDHLGLPGFLSRYYENVDRKMTQLYFGLVNMLVIALTAHLFLIYLRRFGLLLWESMAGSFLYLTSFFVVTYFTIPLVDAAAGLFILAGFYFVLTNSPIGIFLSLLIGMFAKDSVFVLPALIVLVERKLFTRKLAACLVPAVIYAIFISTFSSSSADDGQYVFGVIASADKFMNNLNTTVENFSFYAVIEQLQTFLFLWALFFYAVFRSALPLFLRRAAWLICLAFILPVLVTQSASGRVMTSMLAPVVIPCAIFALRDLLKASADGDKRIEREQVEVVRS